MFFFFVIFQQLEKKGKKKNVGAIIGNGLLPKMCSDQGARHGRWAQGREARRWARRGAERGRTRGARDTGAGGAAWACCWPAGCALGALSLF